jgi:hypothetical protein
MDTAMMHTQLPLTMTSLLHHALVRVVLDVVDSIGQIAADCQQTAAAHHVTQAEKEDDEPGRGA